MLDDILKQLDNEEDNEINYILNGKERQCNLIRFKPRKLIKKRRKININ